MEFCGILWNFTQLIEFVHFAVNEISIQQGLIRTHTVEICCSNLLLSLFQNRPCVNVKFFHHITKLLVTVSYQCVCKCLSVNASFSERRGDKAFLKICRFIYCFETGRDMQIKFGGF